MGQKLGNEDVTVAVAVTTDVGRTGASRLSLKLEVLVWVDDEAATEEEELVVVDEAAGAIPEVVEEAGSGEEVVGVRVLLGEEVAVGWMITVVVVPLAPKKLSVSDLMSDRNPTPQPLTANTRTREARQTAAS